MFSARLPGQLTPNAVSSRLAEIRSSGAHLLDLTGTNPTTVDLDYADDVVAPLASPSARTYEPEPFGLDAARRAVLATYPAATRLTVDDIVLTASTSEAYTLLFKLLCDPGDAVLVPRPSYPLFDLLAGLDGVETRPYRLNLHDAWAIDRDSVERALTPRARAILVVSPNNPTGSMLHRADREWLVSLAAERGLALVSDEVFADFPLTPRADAVSLAGERRALTFTLGGLSKSAALPQMKLAWIAASGPNDVRAEALARLEIIADTYLSVSTPVQLAASALITAGLGRRHAVRARLRDNLDWLRAAVGAYPALTLIEPEGGWAAVVRMPAIEPEEQVVLRLLEEARVLVHPGYFFDFDEEAFLILSLLPPPDAFREGVARMLPLVSGVPS